MPKKQAARELCSFNVVLAHLNAHCILPEDVAVVVFHGDQYRLKLPPWPISGLLSGDSETSPSYLHRRVGL
ncbi:hypothetical protein J6590_067270 [Homalodisca vitripennis]|nr:hypothetical protein J6590_067270 [Homalodisca vitripennis]